MVDADAALEIEDVDGLPPFLMSVVSSEDHWMYVSSAGGLTMGRGEAARCLLPYETDDRLHVATGVTGPLTLVRVPGLDGGQVEWQPFDGVARPGVRRRRLRKGAMGTWVELEERADDVGLGFRYRWSLSERFGFVRTCALWRLDGSAVQSVEVLDGLLNVMPAGVDLNAQLTMSALVDAYKRCELDPETGMGLFTMEALLSDRAEPAEALEANVLWRLGLPGAEVALSAGAIAGFRQHGVHASAPLVTGRRGAYLVMARLDLAGDAPVRWAQVGDVGLGHVEVEALRALITGDADLQAQIDADIAQGRAALRHLLATADGLQASDEGVVATHHLANVLFNCMRGGLFDERGRVAREDVRAHLEQRNRPVGARHQPFLDGLDATVAHPALVEAAEATGDADLVRLTGELLPLFFARRHGDPSRPWNRFSIRVRDEAGRRVLGYEGNWRDIFQNWEALCHAWPDFLVPIIAKFVNASTIDGFNPYRVTDAGIDWEIPEPDSPWSHIGYWGDHQVAYLVRLTEAAERFHPGALASLLDKARFSYADVPYRLLPYGTILRDAKTTIRFRTGSAERIDRRVAAMGTDGRLVCDPEGRVVHVTLAEKLLVPALSKLSNLVPDGGIWMNTQRPEWNDANNALVGHGVSMVTLCHLRRYLAFCARLLDRPAPLTLTTEVARWLTRISGILREHQPLLDAPTLDDRARRAVLDALGEAFSDYRTTVYDDGFSGRTQVPAASAVTLCHTAIAWLDHAIAHNRRDDGLYHAYNLLSLGDGRARVGHLYEMLEGQVAALSAGVLSPEQALGVVDALFHSRMYREDQQSFMLYPERALPGFLAKNHIPADAVADNPLLAALAARGDTRLLVRDVRGAYHFAPDHRAAPDLELTLDTLAEEPRWARLVEAHREATLATWEAVFHHHAFTGRSGTMYKYEGLGSIYWHMVAKLLLAVQEVCLDALDGGVPDGSTLALAHTYYRVRAGLGFNKRAETYGAFPTDPYSHTPAQMGAQQPGMTGQVKEEILTRLGELGVRVARGRVGFDPVLLRRRELLGAARTWAVLPLGGGTLELQLPAGSVGFTFCQVPVVHQVVEGPAVLRVSYADGRVDTVSGHRLSAEDSAALFSRSGAITRIDVSVPAGRITLD